MKREILETIEKYIGQGQKYEGILCLAATTAGSMAGSQQSCSENTYVSRLHM